MTYLLRKLSRIVLAGFFLLGCGTHAWSQYVYLYTYISYDEVTDGVYFNAITMPDYSTYYYYNPKVNMLFYENGAYTGGFSCSMDIWACNYGSYVLATVYEQAQPGVTYSVRTLHSMDIYYYYYYFYPWCTYDCYYWYDYWGYSASPIDCPPICECTNPDPGVPCYCVNVCKNLPDYSRYPLMFSILVSLYDVYLGETSVSAEPVPDLIVSDGGAAVSSGQTVYLTAGSGSSPPQMPALTARLSGASLTGSTTWKANIQFNGTDRSDSDWFPNASGTTLSSASTWNIQSSFGSNHRGGTATIKYKYNNQLERNFSFQIGGTNPTEANARTKLGTSPWFLTRIVRWESAFQQFSGSNPNFGAPHGYGMMMLDPPPGPQQIWNWHANIDEGKSRLSTKKTVLDSDWSNRITEWNIWNAGHPPAQQVGPPTDRVVGTQCTFKWNNAQDGSEAVKSFKDACWIKRYNGAVKDYIYWDNVTHPDNPNWAYDDSANYVNNVCSQAP